MAQDPRKRQKKLEKQKAKKKAECRQVARRQSQGLAGQMQTASKAPILHCCMSDTLYRDGIGEVLVSRLLPKGQVAFVAFLVDIYCLGVKDVHARILPRMAYQEVVFDKLTDHCKLIPLKPECARKLVEGGVRYAESFGLTPHADYRAASVIFGDMAADSCTQEFTYGKDGKPFFVAGPNDDQYRCENILNTLNSRLGPGGYHYLIPVADPSSLSVPDDSMMLEDDSDEFNDEITDAEQREILREE